MFGPRTAQPMKAGLTLLAFCLALISGAAAAEYKSIYKFRGDGIDGFFPLTSLIFDASGNLYGTTVYGGSHGDGTVFKLTPRPDGSWKEGVIHNFHFTDGEFPRAGLMLDTAGNLYGTTPVGGAGGGELCGDDGCGAVFQLTPNPDGTWKQHVLHSFRDDGVDGVGPTSNLVSDAAGNLYGTTAQGGTYHYFGTVFKLTHNPDGSWKEKVLYSFTGGADGGSPRAGLIFDPQGNLYGTTAEGGGTGCDYGCGAVFKLTPNPDGTWSETVIADFWAKTAALPWAGLIFDNAGNLYGTTAGLYQTNGTVFRLSPNPDGSWSKKTLHAFRGPDGADPIGGLVFDSFGNLYGTTWAGGPYNSGTVFQLTPQPDGHWMFTRLHVFKNGQRPPASMVIGTDGNLYGTTSEEGLCGYCGGVFRITP